MAALGGHLPIRVGDMRSVCRRRRRGLSASIAGVARSERGCIGLRLSAPGRRSICRDASDSGIFFRSNDGEGTLYTRIDIAGRSISVMRDAQTPWPHTIEGRQTFPDPKSYYYPFALDPSGLRLFCPDPKDFSPSGEVPCD